MADDPIDTFLRDYAAAVLDRDLARFTDLFSADVQVFDSWDRWRYDGRAPWEAMARGWFGALGETRVRVIAKDVRSWTGDTVASGIATLEFAALDEAGDATKAIQNRMTVTMRREGDRWRVVHQHTSVPVDFQSKQVIAAG